MTRDTVCQTSVAMGGGGPGVGLVCSPMMFESRSGSATDKFGGFDNTPNPLLTPTVNNALTERGKCEHANT